jgi:hypothetical protein
LYSAAFFVLEQLQFMLFLVLLRVQMKQRPQLLIMKQRSRRDHMERQKLSWKNCVRLPQQASLKKQRI